MLDAGQFIADYTSTLLFYLSLVNMFIVILKDKALLESNLSVRVMPRQRLRDSISCP